MESGAELGITVDWYRENDVLLVTFVESWSGDEYRAAVEAANALVRRAGGPVRVILDLRRAALGPRGTVFQTGQKTLNAMPENVSTIFIVAPPRSFARMLLRQFFRVYGRQRRMKGVTVIFADDLEEVTAQLD